MQIIYLVICIFGLLFSNQTFAGEPYEEEIKQYKISSISYDDNLKDGVEIKISGENLSECESISHKGEKLDLEKPNFIYKNGELNGIVTIDCDGVTSHYEYGFPFIESTKVVQEDNFFYVDIYGQNFEKDSKVEIEGLKFEKIYNSQTKIYGKIIGEVEQLDIYVTSKNNDSNKVELDFAYPMIDKIESKNGFLADSKIYIHGKNLGDFDMFVNDTKTTDFIENSQGVIEYTLPNKLKDIDIKFEKYNLTSNQITIKIQGNIPYIEKFYEKNDSDSKTNQILEIYGNNFPFHDEDVEVYLNNEKQVVKNVSKDSITVNDFKFEDGDNYIYIVVNDFQSNTLYKYKDVKLPYPTSIVDVSFDENDRILTLGLENFDEETDTIEVNSSTAKILSCYSNVCRISISKSLLEGKITVKRGDLQHKNFVEFDYSSGQHPHIRKIVFQEDPKGLTKYTIYGNNLLGADISGSNIFTLKSNDKPDIDVSNDTIKARLPRNYDNKSSSISVSKYGMNATFGFSYDEIKNKTVKNAPLILELQPENKSFLQSGKNMFIKGYGFNSGDKLYIGDSQYDIDFSKGYDYPQIQLNKNISTGFYEIYIESENGKKSNKIKKFISQDSQPQVRFEVKDTNKNEFYYNNSSSDALFQMNITNGIEDVYISQLEFIVQGDKNLSDFGEIDLYINNKKIDHTFVDKNGKIIFLKELILEKNNGDIVLEIKKSDKFYAQGKYRISYLGHKTSTSLSNQQVFIDKKVLNGNYFTVGAKDFFNCYNSDGVNQNCDEVEKDTINNEEKKTEGSKGDNSSNNSDKQNNTEEKNNQNSQTTTPNSTKSSMEIKIDNLVENLYKSKTKKSTYSGLIYFKNLKIKLARVIDDVPDSHKDKKLLVYLQDSINDMYTQIFKEYVAEQKKK